MSNINPNTGRNLNFGSPARLNNEQVGDLGAIIGGVAGAGAASFSGPGAAVGGAFGAWAGKNALQAIDKAVDKNFSDRVINQPAPPPGTEGVGKGPGS